MESRLTSTISHTPSSRLPTGDKGPERLPPDVAKTQTTFSIADAKDAAQYRALLNEVPGEDFPAATKLVLLYFPPEFGDHPTALPLLLAQRMPHLTDLETYKLDVSYPMKSALAPRQILEEVLKTRPELAKLTCSCLHLKRESCEWLVHTLQRHGGGLKTLSLTQCSGSVRVRWDKEDQTKSMENLFDALKAVGRLEGLDEKATFDMLVEEMQHCYDVNNEGIAYSGHAPFTKQQLVALAKLPGLQELDLSECNLRDRLLAPMLVSLEENLHLQTLHLVGNTLKKASLKALAGALRENATLASLSFSWGGADDELAPLAEALEGNDTLTGLKIRSEAQSYSVAGPNRLKLAAIVEGNKQRLFELQAKVAMLVVDEPRT